MAEKVSIDGLADAIMEGLEEYKNLTGPKVKTAVQKAGNTVRSDIKQTAPRKTGRYAESWATKKTKESSTSLTVEWETVYGKNSTAQAQKYTVQYSTDGVRWTNATTTATGTSFTITRLKPGTQYQVAVLATKDQRFSASLPSDPLVIMMPEN